MGKLKFFESFKYLQRVMNERSIISLQVEKIASGTTFNCCFIPSNFKWSIAVRQVTIVLYTLMAHNGWQWVVITCQRAMDKALPVVELISVVVSSDDVEQKDVLRLCVQARYSELHLWKHLSGRWNVISSILKWPYVYNNYTCLV